MGAGSVHLVMEICSGPTLQWVLDKRGALSEPETKDIMRQLVEAVAHLRACWLTEVPCILSGERGGCGRSSARPWAYASQHAALP